MLIKHAAVTEKNAFSTEIQQSLLASCILDTAEPAYWRSEKRNRPGLPGKILYSVQYILSHITSIPRPLLALPPDLNRTVRSSCFGFPKCALLLPFSFFSPS